MQKCEDVENSTRGCGKAAVNSSRDLALNLYQLHTDELALGKLLLGKQRS